MPDHAGLELSDCAAPSHDDLRAGAFQTRSVATLRVLSRLPFGPAAIDFMGHMEAPEALKKRVSEIDFQGSVALGALIDPSGEAVDAFSRFGVGLIELGPVSERANALHQTWAVDLSAGTVERRSEELT